MIGSDKGPINVKGHIMNILPLLTFPSEVIINLSHPDLLLSQTPSIPAHLLHI
jgi:hypothetical protein